MAQKSKKPSDMSLLIRSNKGTLSYITEKTNSLSILTNIVRQTCPDLPQEVWHIANFEDNSVVIEVSSSVWSQRLQFERMKINQKLREATQEKYSQIKIKVSPHRNRVALTSTKEEPTFSSSSISLKTANELNSIAQKAPKGLKEKLEKLALHAKK